MFSLGCIRQLAGFATTARKRERDGGWYEPVDAQKSSVYPPKCSGALPNCSERILSKQKDGANVLETLAPQ